ncbi:hypothetical protein C8J56DRAFT_1063642 [Mycena floridula]|nr:hypothetical protein C8J56DRAFT_1063642 [Mycena floridula]
MQAKIAWTLPHIPRHGTKPALTSASLILNPATVWTHSHCRWFLSVVRDTQTLQSLTFDCPAISNTPQNPLTTTNTRHLANLTYLSLGNGNMYPSKAVQLIRLLHHLEHFQVGLLKNESHPISKTLETAHPNIQILHLFDATAELLDLLTLPSLRDFSLIMRAEGHWPQESLVSLTQRSSSKVTTLSIQSRDITATQIIQCLQLPYLENFRLHQGPPLLVPDDIKKRILIFLSCICIVIFISGLLLFHAKCLDRQ